MPQLPTASPGANQGTGFFPTSGTDGRVGISTGAPTFNPANNLWQMSTTPFIVASIHTWSLKGKTASVLVPNFESPVDFLNRVSPLILAGLSTGGVTVEGQYNLDGALAGAGGLTDGPNIRLTNGVFVVLDLWLSKVLQFGINDVYGMVENYTAGSKAENTYANFSCDITTSGIIQVSAPIT